MDFAQKGARKDFPALGAGNLVDFARHFLCILPKKGLKISGASRRKRTLGSVYFQFGLLSSWGGGPYPNLEMLVPRKEVVCKGTLLGLRLGHMLGLKRGSL